MDRISAHAGRMAWDEWLLVAAFGAPLMIAVCYFAFKAMRSSR